MGAHLTMCPASSLRRRQYTSACSGWCCHPGWSSSLWSQWGQRRSLEALVQGATSESASSKSNRIRLGYEDRSRSASVTSWLSIFLALAWSMRTGSRSRVCGVLSSEGPRQGMMNSLFVPGSGLLVKRAYYVRMITQLITAVPAPPPGISEQGYGLFAQVIPTVLLAAVFSSIRDRPIQEMRRVPKVCYFFLVFFALLGTLFAVLGALGDIFIMSGTIVWTGFSTSLGLVGLAVFTLLFPGSAMMKLKLGGGKLIEVQRDSAKVEGLEIK